MIEFDRVSFSYGNRLVLNDLSFSVHEDERVAILGGSGDGKTTILKLIVGLLRPDSGKILIDGEDITEKQRMNSGISGSNSAWSSKMEPSSIL